MPKSPPYTRPFILDPIDPSSQNHMSDLAHQRRLCGWKKDAAALAEYARAIRAGSMQLFWIAALPDVVADTHPAPDACTIRAGHIGLISVHSPPDERLARPDRSILSLSTLFILPAHRSTGLGRAAFARVEDLARRDGRCEWLTVDVHAARYDLDGGPDWGGLMRRCGIEPLGEARSTQGWYERMGFEVFCEEARYRHVLEEGPVLLRGCLMRKRVGGGTC